MPEYVTTQWQDRVVERPRTYTVTNNPDGTLTLTPSPGTVMQEGTLVSATVMNKIEQGITDAHNGVDDAWTALVQHASAGAPHSGHATTAALSAHTSASAPHTGHETPAGATAKVAAHSADVVAHGLKRNGGAFYETTAIAAGAKYKKSIPLGASDYKVGLLFFASYGASIKVGPGGVAIVKPTKEGAAILGTSNNLTNLASNQQTSGALGVTEAGPPNSANAGFCGSQLLYLDYVQIVGSNLEIQWGSWNESAGASLNVRVTWEVFR